MWEHDDRARDQCPKVGVTRAASALRELVPQRFRRDRPVVPVLRLAGVIGISSLLRPGLTHGRGRALARSRRSAFATPRAVALVINSPGGSPAQSHLIFRRIRDLAAEKIAARSSPSSRMPRPQAAICSPAPPTRSSADPSSDRRLDRRGRRLVRFRQADRQDRRRAPALYLGRAQGDARSVPA